MPSGPITLTPLQFAALAIYAEAPRHPYDVYQEMLRRREDRLVKVRPGTLYHAVNRLVDHALLSESGTDRDGNRPERTTYAITDAGRDAVVGHVAQMLARRAEEYPEFALAVAELHTLEPGAAADLLERRADALRAELASLSEAEPQIIAKGLPEVLWIEHSWILTTTTADLTWTEQLIARLRTGDLAWSEESLGAYRDPTTSDARSSTARPSTVSA